MSKQYLAIDLGPSGGRAVLGSIENGTLRLREIHQFSNTPATIVGHRYWDVLRLFLGIKNAMVKAKELGGFSSIALNAWGMDYALLDKSGGLLRNPYQHRDTRTNGLVQIAEDFLPAKQSYVATGVQAMDMNTIYQLFADWRNTPHLFENVDKFLMMPDLFNYMLTGVCKSERSIASTSQFLDIHTGFWCPEQLAALGIPVADALPPLVSAGSVLGELLPELCEELGIPSAKVIAVCEHDVQCAMAAVPTPKKDFIFLSCGTWALFGTELEHPILNEQARCLGMTHAIGYDGRISFLQNISGMWLIQETKRWLAAHGETYSYAQLESFAVNADPFISLIDVDDPRFASAGNMPEMIREYCAETDQPIPRSIGALMRCIYESLALRFMRALSDIKTCTGKEYLSIHMFDGGVKDKVLCQMTANACGIPVVAGPAEATICGNLIVQMLADGEIDNLSEARNLIAHSFTLTIYQPDADWSKAYERYLALIGK